MPTDQFQSDVAISGNLSCGTFSAPVSCIGDANVSSSNPLLCTKSYQQVRAKFSQAHGVAAITERRVIHKAQAAGSVYAIKALLVIPNIGAATITVDLRKNGTTVMTGVITLSSTGVAYIASSGAIATTSYAVDDVFELVITATVSTGTLGQGLFIDTIFRELPG